MARILLGHYRGSVLKKIGDTFYSLRCYNSKWGNLFAIFVTRREFLLKKLIGIFVLLVALAAMAQEPVPDSLAPAGIIFNGVVQDSSFAPGEKLNVEILESGEAVQTTVGTPFSVILPEDTLWNVCVTNSDTSGAEKEKCYELVYSGTERSFSQTLGEAFVQDENALAGDSAGAVAGDSSGVILSEAQAESKDPDLMKH